MNATPNARRLRLPADLKANPAALAAHLRERFGIEGRDVAAAQRLYEAAGHPFRVAHHWQLEGFQEADRLLIFREPRSWTEAHARMVVWVVGYLLMFPERRNRRKLAGPEAIDERRQRKAAATVFEAEWFAPSAEEIARQKARLHLLERRLYAVGERLLAEVTGTGYGLYAASIRDEQGNQVAFGGGSTQELALSRACRNAGVSTPEVTLCP